MDGGMRRGNITCLGAQSGHGKTTISIQFARYAASCFPDHSVVVLSPEMRPADIGQMAALSTLGRSREWLVQHPSEFDRPGVRDRIMEQTPANLIIASMPPYLDENKLTFIVSQLAEMHGERRLALVVVDYAQYLIGEMDEGKRQRFALAGDIVREFNLLANRTGCAVLMTSQVRTAKGKDGKIADIAMRESALFEHASAAVVYFIREIDDEGRECASYFKIAKNRYGRLGNRITVDTKPGCYYIADSVGEVD